MTTQTETIKMLREALEHTLLQIEYLHRKFAELRGENGLLAQIERGLSATQEPQEAPEPVAREVARRTQFTYDELALGIELRGQVGIELARHPPSLCLADWRGFAKQVCDLFNKPIVTAPQAAPAERISLKPMANEDEALTEWYFDCDGHYIDVQRDKDGKYSVYFRNRTDESEAWIDQAAPAVPSERETFEKWAEDRGINPLSEPGTFAREVWQAALASPGETIAPVSDEEIIDAAWQHLTHASGGMYQSADREHFHGSPDEILAFARSLARTAPPDGWQPIETAPKDGFHYLLYAPEIQFAGFWSGLDWCVVAPGCPVAPTQPTRWRPLDAAPSTQEKQG